MKAIAITRYGSPDVLKLEEIARPIPNQGEILIEVKAASVTAADTMMRKGIPWFGRLFMGLTKPKHRIAGTGFSGVVIATGKGVEKCSIGEEVFGESVLGAGTNAEFLCISEDGVLARKPSHLSHEQVASVCDGPLTSWNFLKEMANVKPGQQVMINGASGSLGTAAVQLAKHLGAKVTGVCSTDNIDLVRSLGADDVVDYTQTDPTKLSRQFDVIFDTVGKLSYAKSKNILAPTGTFLSPVLSVSLLFQMMWSSLFEKKKAKFSATGLKPIAELRDLLNELTDLLQRGKLRTIIDRTYHLTEAREAHQYVDSGRKKGNVVLSM
ncbi:MAG: NAD(P)-dependent alcohol dehydrogenase [Saprospiraceae bacterium]|nr:NAD(P)-dependent alcohol dehydrogenase [Saprospiraceae bacterium]